MIARAPGKVVLSGAYAVLEGAPALVAAVDRYAVADTDREAIRVTPEVREALARRPGARAPWFDASELRDASRDQKLGLGSSAAILVASLGALELTLRAEAQGDDLADRVMPAALAAHRAAQGGGSGIDVAASALGGILRFERATPDAPPRVSRVALPPGLFIQVWSSGESASTRDMLSRVDALRNARPLDHQRLMGRLCAAAQATADACDAVGFVAGCREQRAVFDELGPLAGVAIVSASMRAFDEAVARTGVILPSGAGGGDIVLLIDTGPAGDEVERAGRNAGFSPPPITLGARGVHAWSADSQRSRKNARAS